MFALDLGFVQGGCGQLSLEEQGALFEEWALQVFFAFCSPLED